VGLEGLAARAVFHVFNTSSVPGCFELLRAFATRSWMVNNGG